MNGRLCYYGLLYQNSYHQVELISGHHGVRRNKKGDECTVCVSSLDDDMVCNEVLITLVVKLVDLMIGQ